MPNHYCRRLLCHIFTFKTHGDHFGLYCWKYSEPTLVKISDQIGSNQLKTMGSNPRTWHLVTLYYHSHRRLPIHPSKKFNSQGVGRHLLLFIDTFTVSDYFPRRIASTMVIFEPGSRFHKGNILANRARAYMHFHIHNNIKNSSNIEHHTKVIVHVS